MIGRALPLCVLAGCSNLLGIQELRPAGDAGPGADGADGADGVAGDAIDASSTDAATVPITVTGVVRTAPPASMPFVTQVELVLLDTTVVQTTMSDAAGKFSMTVQAPGGSIDVAVRARGEASMTHHDGYVYFAAPLTGNRDVNVTLLTDNELQLAANTVGFSYTTDYVFIVATVEDAAGYPVPGEQLATDRSDVVRYPGANGNNATSPDGTAYVFSSIVNGLARPVTVSGTGPVNVAPRMVRLFHRAVVALELRP